MFCLSEAILVGLGHFSWFAVIFVALRGCHLAGAYTRWSDAVLIGPGRSEAVFVGLVHVAHRTMDVRPSGQVFRA